MKQLVAIAFFDLEQLQTHVFACSLVAQRYPDNLPAKFFDMRGDQPDLTPALHSLNIFC